MAAKKDTKKSEERTYTIPLRKEFMKVPTWRKTEKAVKAAQEFLLKHFKAEEVKLGKEVNDFIWKHGIKNPPPKVKVTAAKDENGVVHAELFGVKKKEPAAEKGAKKAAAKAIKAAKSEKSAASEKEQSSEAPVTV